MIKRYISLVLNSIIFISILCCFFTISSMNVISFTIFLLIITISFVSFAIDLAMILYFNDYKTNRKIILSYKDFNKYLNIAPERYNCSEFSMVYYMTGVEFKYIHTVIFFDSIISNIRYLMNRGSICSNKYMKQYLDSVAEDIEKYRKESEKKIQEAIDSQKEILSRIITRNDHEI